MKYSYFRFDQCKNWFKIRKRPPKPMEPHPWNRRSWWTLWNRAKPRLEMWKSRHMKLGHIIMWIQAIPLWQKRLLVRKIWEINQTPRSQSSRLTILKDQNTRILIPKVLENCLRKQNRGFSKHQWPKKIASRRKSYPKPVLRRQNPKFHNKETQSKLWGRIVVAVKN